MKDIRNRLLTDHPHCAAVVHAFDKELTYQDFIKGAYGACISETVFDALVYCLVMEQTVKDLRTDMETDKIDGLDVSLYT